MLSAGIVAVVAAVVLIVALAPRAPEPQASPVPQADTPPVSATPGPGLSGAVDEAWAAEVAAATGIPERAVLAYAGAAIDTAANRASCGIGWNTIAAVGLIESDHGRHDGSSIGADGTVSPPIYGPALTGDGTADIDDTDGGVLDGDREHDRAVGPMQFIPASWASWGYDANADGRTDPQNIDDAAIAAANYLCRSSGEDMVSADGWRTGIGGYNVGEQYLRDVEAAARDYADAAP
jgi:membrane-bound lytic murein transglycosylase B